MPETCENNDICTRRWQNHCKNNGIWTQDSQNHNEINEIWSSACPGHISFIFLSYFRELRGSRSYFFIIFICLSYFRELRGSRSYFFHIFIIFLGPPRAQVIFLSYFIHILDISKSQCGGWGRTWQEYGHLAQQPATSQNYHIFFIFLSYFFHIFFGSAGERSYFIHIFFILLVIFFSHFRDLA